jgi:hypothetical protein
LHCFGLRRPREDDGDVDEVLAPILVPLDGDNLVGDLPL